MVGSSKTPAFWSRPCSTLRKFKVFVDLLEQLYDVVLPIPNSFESLSSFKDFCSAILERRSHIWDIALSRLSADHRRSIGMSLFLFRKVVPADRPCPFELLEKLSRPSPSLDGCFLEFVRSEVNRLFPVGWDKGYIDQCLRVTLPTKSYAEINDGCEGGSSREWFLENTGCGQWDARQSFLEVVMTTTEPFIRKGDRSRLVVVPSGGKFRALSIPPVRMNYLRPLHKTFYDFMSGKDWLLRGDATVNQFKGFKTVPGEVFCSGDYESATDNLNQELQKEVLRLVLQRARHVPSGVIVSAMRSFSLDLVASDRQGRVERKEQKSGQMMGNLLSFPLLCLTNYVTFRYATMDLRIPVRINGDDIVFRSSEFVVKRWKETVSKAGLVLSQGKTLVESRYFTINSTLFKAGPGGPRAVPFIRSKALFGGDLDSVASLRGRYNSFAPRYGSIRRGRARVVFLRENSGWIRKSCRSLTAGLGLQVEPEVLAQSGMLSRELRYLAEVEKPLPNLPSQWGHMPVGYHLRWVDKETKRIRSRCKGLEAEFIECCWKPKNEYEKQITLEQAYCRGLDLSDAVILRNREWTMRMVRLGRSFLEKFYGQMRDMYRRIKTWWSSVDRSLLKVRQKKLFPCWFRDDEVCPIIFRSERHEIEVKSLSPSAKEQVLDESQDCNNIGKPNYHSVAPPLILTDPGWFEFEDRCDDYLI